MFFKFADSHFQIILVANFEASAAGDVEENEDSLFDVVGPGSEEDVSLGSFSALAVFFVAIEVSDEVIAVLVEILSGAVFASSLPHSDVFFLGLCVVVLSESVSAIVFVVSDIKVS